MVCVRNVMAHAQKPDFVFRQKGRVQLHRRGASVQSTTGSRVVRISGSNAGCTMFRGSVKATHSIRLFPLHFPSRAPPCAITFQLEPTIQRLITCVKLAYCLSNAHLICAIATFVFTECTFQIVLIWK